MKNETSEAKADESKVGVIGKIVRIMGGIHIYSGSGHSPKTDFLLLLLLIVFMTGAGIFLFWEKEQPYFIVENICLKSDDSLVIRAGKDDSAKYHVEKQGKDGTKYVSNTATYRNPEITNSINMKFVWIEPGTFLMGSPKNEPGRNSDEKQHQVTLIKGFYMQITEVTQGQWKTLMGNNPSEFKNCGDDCPVENVSWEDAQAFISKLNQKEGKDIYSLPTEAQWEYAARAATDTPFAFGKCLSTDEANYNSNYPLEGCAKGIYREKTLPAGSLKANAWGLYDMHGNVWEWCQDWYGDYPSGSVTNPEGSSTGSYRVLRGGGWNLNAVRCRSARRFWILPGGCSISLGFRLVLSPSQQ